MKGIIFPEKGKIELLDEPAAEPESGRLFCQTIYSGLTNGTERNVLMGGNYGGKLPARCGYQNVGRILEVGEGCEGWQEGDLLFCGDFCQHVAFFNANPDGLVVKIPSSVDPKHAALFGMAGVAMHDVRRAETKLGDRVLIVGAGPIGQFTAQAARASGADVTVADINSERLAIAEECGSSIIEIVSDDTWESIKEHYCFDIVFEDSGAAILDQILGRSFSKKNLLKRRGKLVMIAGRFDVSYSFNAGQSLELAVLHAGHFSRDDLILLAKLVADGTVTVAPIIKDVVKIDKAIAVYERLRDDPASLFGTVFDWT